MAQTSSSLSKLRTLWLAKGISGLLCTGFGLSLFGEAVIRKASGESWFWLGTLCLIVFNFGLCLLFDSHNHQLQLERQHRSHDLP
ncbi:hypothetical protein C7271_04985 [filamentous cyanobacterium CCP5]|nr:hypothetical protein C7271_04985 [filamentous cyanobacterium CCP5]